MSSSGLWRGLVINFSPGEIKSLVKKPGGFIWTQLNVNIGNLDVLKNPAIGKESDLSDIAGLFVLSKVRGI